MAAITSLQSTYAGFSPTSIPGCVLWLDASDASTLSLAGNVITQWKSKTSAQYSTTVLGSPTYITSQYLPGKKVVNMFDYQSDGLLIGPLVQPQPLTIIGLTVQNSGWYDTYSFVFEGTSADSATVVYVPSLDLYAGQDQYMSPDVGLQYNIPAIYTCVFNGNASTLGYNGTRTTGLNPGTGGLFNALALGVDWTGSAFSSAEVAEVLVYSGALSLAQQQQVEGYLAAKWGIRGSLPGTHPYKSIPVVTRPFLPIDISGCEAWFDGADTSAMTFSGSTIMQWLDKSGSGRHAKSVGTQAPVLGTTTTGLTALSFNGSNYLSMNSADTLAPNSATYFLQASASSPNNRTLLAMWQNSRVMGPTYYWNTGANLGLTPYTWLNTNAVLTVTENSASNCAVHFNGNLVGTIGYKARSFTEGYAASSVSQVYIGAHWSRDNLWIGTIQEIIMYNGALTSNQRQQVEAYLTNKWRTHGATPAGHLVRLTVPLTPIFFPTQIPGCTLWLDAADSSTVIRSGSTVTQWNDKSGNGRNATTGGSGVTYLPSGLNKNGVVSFDGTTSMDGVCPVNGNSNMTIIVVANNKTDQSDGYNDTMSLIAWFENGSWGEVFLDVWQGQVNWRFGTGQDQNDNSYYFPASIGTEYAVLILNKTSDIEKLFHNGTNVATVGGKNSTINGCEDAYHLSAGNYGGPSTNNICEILVFTSQLTASQMQQIEGYLTAKWGLRQKLPTTHPFKTITI